MSNHPPSAGFCLLEIIRHPNSTSSSLFLPLISYPISLIVPTINSPSYYFDLPLFSHIYHFLEEESFPGKKYVFASIRVLEQFFWVDMMYN
ncbi:hypothetical protein P3L10_019014 [Capsicum annuum]